MNSRQTDPVATGGRDWPLRFRQPMQIYLLRHGIAEDASPGQADADRALTPEGIKRLREILKRARTASVAPTVIVTSPYVRARQTAE